MLFNFAAPADAAIGESLILTNDNARWSVDSEYGRLLDVMLSAPTHLELLPCNPVAIEHSRNGLSCCPDRASEQHERLKAVFEAAGVRCRLVPPSEGLADLAFTRDATLMTPWGLLGLNPAAKHRTAEVAHILAAAKRWGVPLLGAISDGHIEGGDVCLLRPGLVAIGYSGERTDQRGAEALARLFEVRGWRAILTRFAADFLHLDTQFTMVERNCAIACRESLDSDFLAKVEALRIELLPVTVDEVHKLGANIFSLGDGRVISAADNDRVNAALEQRGFTVFRVEIDQFTRCGGGIHCLTMPLARLPG